MKLLQWYEGILPVLDFETTGVDVEKDRVIQAALVFEAPGGYVLPSSIITYVDPGEEALQQMPQAAIDTHCITPEMAREGRASDFVFMNILSLLQAIANLGLPLLIYNAPFDWRILHYECRRHRLPDPPPLAIIDPLLIDYRMDKYRKGSRKLSALAEHYGVELKNAHIAEADCVATAEVFRRMLKWYPHLRDYTPSKLVELQMKWFEIWKRDRNRYWASQGDDRRIEHSWPGM